jgi:DNA-binding MarR family transcriptional regulator
MADLPESEPYRLANSPSHLLHRAEQLAADRFARLVGDAITLRQFSVLAAIAQNPGLSQSDLVRATGVDRSTLADMMTRMERNGWISREESASDGRAYSVRLAQAGSRLLATTTQHARAADAAILDLLTPRKRKAFLATLGELSKLAAAAEEKAERRAKRQAKREAREKKRGKSSPPKQRQRVEPL